ncbi:MAG: mannitol dehydrogenase family protein [Alphaproteobacteria bacterium]|nr:mannitol dehydrogenase family protein [Alphaproteobacteria bacterium SS10]
MSTPNARPLSQDMVDNPPENVAIVEKPPENGKIGIVHLGLGNFARAHWASIIDDMPADQKGDWGISGVSMRSARIRDQLEPQDNLYTLTERRPEGDKTRIISAVKETLVGPEDPQRLIARIAHPDTKVVSMTITQGGYKRDDDDNLDPQAYAIDKDYLVDGEAPRVADEIAGTTPPVSMPAVLTEALKQRKEAGLPPITVACLDNIPDNGAVTKKVLQQFAEAKYGKELADYIGYNIVFPNSMVDRITPAASAEDAQSLVDKHGISDASPVFTEPYRQLIIEDNFAEGTKPPIGDVQGVKLTEDVRPFEAAKIRMLNGAHMMMGALGRVAGFKTVDEVMADPDMGAFTKRFLSEVAATIDPIPGTDMQVYADDLVERFDNPQLKDSVDRLANDTSKKLKPRLMDAIHASIHKGTPNQALGVALAGWQRFIGGVSQNTPTPESSDKPTGVTDTGRVYVISDPRAKELQDLAREEGPNVNRVHEAMGFGLSMYGKNGQDLRRRVQSSLETMLKGDAMSAIRAVTMRLDELPKPVVPKDDGASGGPKPPGPEDRSGPKLS